MSFNSKLILSVGSLLTLCIFGCANKKEADEMSLFQAKYEENLVRSIEDSVKRSSEYTNIKKLSDKALEAIKLTPRHLFLKDEDKGKAFLKAVLRTLM